MKEKTPFTLADYNQVCGHFFPLFPTSVITSEHISHRLSAMFSLDTDLRARKRIPDMAVTSSHSISHRRFS